MNNHSSVTDCDTEVFGGYVLRGGLGSVWAQGSELVWARVALQKSHFSRIFFFFVYLCFGLWKKSRHIVFYLRQLVTHSSADLTHFMIQILLLHIILTDRL